MGRGKGRHSRDDRLGWAGIRSSRGSGRHLADPSEAHGSDEDTPSLDADRALQVESSSDRPAAEGSHEAVTPRPGDHGVADRLHIGHAPPPGEPAGFADSTGAPDAALPRTASRPPEMTGTLEERINRALAVTQDTDGNAGFEEPSDLGFDLVVDDRDASDSDRHAAERYLVAQVLEMLDPVGTEQEDHEMPSSAGAVLITLEDGEVSAAEMLARTIEVSEYFRTSSVDRGLRSLLGGRVSAWQLHRWLEQSFFERHVALSNGNPTVWHLSTRSGTFQVLVRADHVDAQSLRKIRGWVRKTQDRLEFALADAERAGDRERVESVRARIDEMFSFDTLLVEMGRNGWRVGGSLDRAAKLAVLRHRGAVPATSQLQVHRSAPLLEANEPAAGR